MILCVRIYFNGVLVPSLCVLLLYGVLVLYVLLVMILCVRIYFNGVLVPSLCVLLLWCVSAIRTVSDDTVCSYLFQWCVSAFLVLVCCVLCCAVLCCLLLCLSLLS